MNEFQIRRMKRHAGNSTLRGFFRTVLPIADDRMPIRGKLHANLILQSRQQRNPQQGSSAKGSFDGVTKLGARSFGIPRRARLLVHTLFSKVVNQRSLLCGGMSTNHRQILSDGSMREKLPDQRVSIRIGLGEQENSGGETVDAMDDQGLLSAGLQVLQQKR